MEIFNRILQTAVEGGASDIHIKVGCPIVFRINRQLIAIDDATVWQLELPRDTLSPSAGSNTR